MVNSSFRPLSDTPRIAVNFDVGGLAG